MKRKGFNLIELVTVIAIIAILSSIAYATYTGHTARTRTKNAPACIGSIAVALENYFTNAGVYPPAGDFAALGLPSADCNNGYYSFSWELDATGQYYKITVQDDVRSVYGQGSYGLDIWVQCSQTSTPLNIQSPDNINMVDPDPVCW